MSGVPWCPVLLGTRGAFAGTLGTLEHLGMFGVVFQSVRLAAIELVLQLPAAKSPQSGITADESGEYSSPGSKHNQEKC